MEKCVQKKRNLEWYWGYIQVDTGKFTDAQNTTQVCRRIKRYPINDEESLLVTDGKVSLIKNKDVNDKIFYTFLFTGSFRSLVFYMLDFYDETTDTYYLWMFFKVINV